MEVIPSLHGMATVGALVKCEMASCMIVIHREWWKVLSTVDLPGDDGSGAFAVKEQSK